MHTIEGQAADSCNDLLHLSVKPSAPCYSHSVLLSIVGNCGERLQGGVECWLCPLPSTNRSFLLSWQETSAVLTTSVSLSLTSSSALIPATLASECGSTSQWRTSARLRSAHHGMIIKSNVFPQCRALFYRIASLLCSISAPLNL